MVAGRSGTAPVLTAMEARGVVVSSGKPCGSQRAANPAAPGSPVIPRAPSAVRERVTLFDEARFAEAVQEAVDFGRRGLPLHRELAYQAPCECLPVLPRFDPLPHFGAGGVEPVIALGIQMQNHRLSRELGGVHVLSNLRSVAHRSGTMGAGCPGVPGPTSMECSTEGWAGSSQARPGVPLSLRKTIRPSGSQAGCPHCAVSGVRTVTACDPRLNTAMRAPPPAPDANARRVPSGLQEGSTSGAVSASRGAMVMPFNVST